MAVNGKRGSGMKKKRESGVDIVEDGIECIKHG